MTPGHRVLCITGRATPPDRLSDALHAHDASLGLDVTDAPGDALAGTLEDGRDEYVAAVVTDDDVDPIAALDALHSAAPGLPVLVAPRRGDDGLASDAIAHGADAYASLDDDQRLAARLDDLLAAGHQPPDFFDRLVEHVGVGVAAYRRDGHFTYVNPAYAALLGRDRDALEGAPLWDVNPDIDPGKFPTYFDSFTTGETRRQDTVHRRANGDVVPVHTVTTQIDVGGRPLHVGTITDISRRVETERKIQALHDVATALTDLDDEAAVHELVVDAADRILDLEACYFVARRDGAFAVRASTDAAPDVPGTIPDEGVLWETYDAQTARLVTDARTDETARPHREDFVSAVSAPVGTHGVLQAIAAEPNAYDDDDRELAALLATHAAAALDRIRFETELRAERDRFAALFDNVPNAVVAYELRDGDAIVQDVNPGFEDVFGYERDDLLASDVDEIIVPDDEQVEAAELNADLAAGRSVTAEVRRLTADGARDFLLDVVPLETGETNGAGYAIYTDITEQKQRERQLSRQNDRLEEFASVVSHDLRNPLNVASGRLDLAAETATGETATHVDHARQALDRMDALVSDVLALARDGRTVGETSRVALASAARAAWSTVDTADATLVVADAPTIQADGDRVRQLLENLFRNAVEHGSAEHRDAARADGASGHASAEDAGSGDDATSGDDDTSASVTVTVGGLPDGFYVADDGPGIPEPDREDVFASGYTTSADGTGLGLSIVERIAGAHGWDVTVTESERGGAQFDVTGVTLVTD